MPIYNYRNMKTGEVWSEYRSIDEMMHGVDDINVELLLAAPSVESSALDYKGFEKFERDVLAPKAEKQRGSYEGFNG